LGCADLGTPTRRMSIAVASILWTLIAWVFILAALCLWTTFPYSSKAQGNPPSVFVPIWVNPSQNFMSVVQVYDMRLGPAWATAVTSAVLLFLVNIAQCLSLRSDAGEEDSYVPPMQNNTSTAKQPAIGTTQPVPTATGRPMSRAVPPAILPHNADVANV
jgi:hypothetical protein